MDYKKTLTYADILEIPSLLNSFNMGIKNPEKLKSNGEVFLLGRGSSGNATIFAKYIWETYCATIVNFIHPHSIFNAKKKLNFKNKAVWAFSQSGKSPDIVDCCKTLKKWGAKTVAVTNEADMKENKLAGICDFNILLSKSKEVPVAATKSFELQLLCALKTAQLWKAGFKKSDFDGLAEAAQKLIKNFELFYKKYDMERLLKKHNLLGFVGRGPFNAIAEDSALKFREMAFRHSFGYSAAEFLHGPVGSYGKKDLVLLLGAKEKPEEDLIKVIKKLEERKTPYKFIAAPYNLTYPFNSVITDIFLKLCALKNACERNVNPDSPKGLSKVTHTK